MYGWWQELECCVWTCWIPQIRQTCGQSTDIHVQQIVENTNSSSLVCASQSVGEIYLLVVLYEWQ